MKTLNSNCLLYLLIVFSGLFNTKLLIAQGISEMVQLENAVSRNFSVYIVMRDGVRIAADVHLPRTLKKGEKIPTLLYQTIYLRSYRIPVVENPQISDSKDWQIGPRLDHKTSRPIDFLALENGYAIVKTDVRGTGASFGIRNSPLPPEEVYDTKQVIDWIVAQDWSSGKVGSYGVSYTGMTAGMAPVVRHPALKAIVLGWTGIYDEYKTAMQPYGLVQPGIVCAWSDLLVNLWSNNWRATGQSPMPVDGDEGGVLLAKAIKEHQQNETVCDLLTPVTYSDDVIGKQKLSIQSFSQKQYKNEIF